MSTRRDQFVYGAAGHAEITTERRKRRALMLFLRAAIGHQAHGQRAMPFGQARHVRDGRPACGEEQQR
jgi:hypothetical protein